MHRRAAILAGLLFCAQCGGTETDNPATPPDLPDVARSPLAYDTAPVVASETQSALIGDLNGFGLRVLQQLAPSDQNLVLSPASGFIALTMTSAGAQGTTADEMKAVLYPSVSLAEIHPATNQLEQRIRGYARSLVTTSDGDKRVELNLVNDDFVQKSMAIEQPFLDTLAVNYDCGVELVDYAADPGGARTRINNWVAQATSDRIPNLIPTGMVDAYTRLVLVNALYLYASWMTAFGPDLTSARTFQGIGGDASTDFMHATLGLSYAAGSGWVAVDVPYFGDSLVLTAVLPDAGQFDAVKASLDAAWLVSFDATSQPEQVALSIPKFKLSGQTVEWNQALQSLGMSSLFDATCNLLGITPPPSLYVQSVLQQVFVELGEKGTEAAAATAVIISRDGGISPITPLSVVLDRPFLFFIRERGGPVLFAGQVVSLPVAG